MKTKDLVELLAADRTVMATPERTLGLALVPGFSLALLLFLEWVGFRDDLGASLASWRFDFKLLLNVLLAAVSAGLLLRLARPAGAAGMWPVLLWALALLLAIAVVLELALLPASQWWPVARGSNATWCLRVIPLLALAPLLATLWSMRRAAPTRPALTGAVAGLMSAGIAGALYAAHCPDDSALFVAIWYVIAAALVTALGALLGARWLRW